MESKIQFSFCGNTNPQAQVDLHSPLCSCKPSWQEVQLSLETQLLQVCRQGTQTGRELLISLQQPASHWAMQRLPCNSNGIWQVMQKSSVAPEQLSQVEWQGLQCPSSKYSKLSQRERKSGAHNPFFVKLQPISQLVQMDAVQLAQPGGQGTHSRLFLSALCPPGQELLHSPVTCSGAAQISIFISYIIFMKINTSYPINLTTPIGTIVPETPIQHNRNSIAIQYNLNSAANSAKSQVSGQFGIIATQQPIRRNRKLAANSV